MTGAKKWAPVYTAGTSETLSQMTLNELSGHRDNVSEVTSERIEGVPLSRCRQLEGLGQRGYRALTSRRRGRRADHLGRLLGYLARRPLTPIR
jgi:hypothetical protein